MTEALEIKQKITPNEMQLKCIQHLDGPMMVLAGPGTGKTFTVTKRIKYMLENGISPETILCLTYSDTAAGEMKTKLVKEAGSIGSAVSINTYHSFCNEIIKFNHDDFELLDGISLADDITKQTLISEAIKEFKPNFYLTKWGDADYFVPKLLKNVEEIKRNQITKEQYFYNLEHHPLWKGKMDELEAEKKQREQENKPLKSFMTKYEAHQNKMGKAREAWEIYEIYDRLLKNNNFIDFDDMIRMVLEQFDSNEELLNRVSSQYKYFLVDEYQDTNYSQNNIVFKLAEGAGSENIFVVGDDDQIIYEFQGAKTDTLAKFLKKFPNTEVVCLTENNRSTQTILDFSYKVISQDKTRLEANPEFKQYNINKKLTAKNTKICDKDQKIKLHCFTESTQEVNFIVNEIEDLIKTHDFPKNDNNEPDLSSVAILTRNNAELEKYAELLKSKNIKYQIKITNSIFQMKPSLLIYFYLKALYNHAYYSDKLFGLLGSEPFSFEAEDYCFLLSKNRLNHKDFIENIRENLNHEWKNKEKVLNFIETYDELKAAQSKESLKDLITSVCNKTGILDYYMKSENNRVDNILAIKRIIDEAGALKRIKYSASLGDFIEHLDTAIERGIAINIDKDDYVQNAVQLITIHSSKGRQFDYVYIPNLVSSQWEKKRNNNDISLPIIDEADLTDDISARNSENLRLLFVGITRAKYGLTLSYSNSENGKSKEFTSYLSNVTEDNLFDKYIHELSEEEYAFEIIKSYKKKPYDYEGVFKDEIEQRVNDIILSPSTLNRYLACPRDFFYTFILKVPVFEGSWNASNYGTAVHSTLEQAAIRYLQKGRYPDENEFIDMFEYNLNLNEFDSEADRKMYLERGKASLIKYYKSFTETSNMRLYKVEYNFESVPIENEKIKGKIDRIEINSDGTYNLYDYKTGSAKPYSQIEDGKKYENYLNQLRFYKLAYETQNENAKVSKTGLIFIEDCNKNFYTELTDDDNEYIKSKILETYSSIKKLDFEPSYKEEACEYCSYKHLCNLDLF